MSAWIEAMLVTRPQIVPTLTALTTALVREDTQYFKTSSFAHKLSPTEISPHFKGLFSHTTLVHSITSPFMLLDIDECRDESHDCDINANCTNTNGSHICTCKEGYTGKGGSCQGTIRLDFEKKQNTCSLQIIALLSNKLTLMVLIIASVRLINGQSCQWRIQQRYLMSSKAAFHN